MYYKVSNHFFITNNKIIFYFVISIKLLKTQMNYHLCVVIYNYKIGLCVIFYRIFAFINMDLRLYTNIMVLNG
jgi:hypothetical protein